MKKLALLCVFALFGSLVLLNSCDDDDDETFKVPSITAPSNSTVIEGETVVLEFSYSAEGGFKSASVQAVNGAATITTDGTTNATSGKIVVSFVAGTEAGAGSVTLTVTDAQGQTNQTTAVLTVKAEETQISVNSNISENTTWKTGNVYILGGRITVLDGVTLTIEPGVIVKGEAGAKASATALMIARGGKLMAEGTADAPIIFTSVADEITPEDVASGNFASPNLGSSTNGYWGGVIVLGKAPIVGSNPITGEKNLSEVQIEGIPTSDQNGLYGGTVADDNSGVLKYISIRHGGTDIGSGNEINGLSLGGVGSGTTIDHIEVVANQDDGIEWFGGTVNVSNVVVWNVGDDGIDTDQAWSGTLNNFAVVSVTGNCFELDGPEGTTPAGHTGHILQNGTIFASTTVEGNTYGSEDLINVDDNSFVTLKDLYFTEILDGQKINKVTAPGVIFTGIEFNVAAADLASHVDGAVPAGVTAVSSPTVGADLTVFGWTWASQAGALGL